MVLNHYVCSILDLKNNKRPLIFKIYKNAYLYVFDTERDLISSSLLPQFSQWRARGTICLKTGTRNSTQVSPMGGRELNA